MKVSTEQPPNPSWEYDWQRWYRFGLIGFLVWASFRVSAEGETAAPALGLLPTTQENLPEVVPAFPAAVEPSAAEPVIVPEIKQPMLPQLPSLGEPAEGNSSPGQQLPRPDSAPAKDSSAPANNPEAVESKPEQQPAITEPAKPQTSANTWTTLITPGQSSLPSVTAPAQLVTYQLDADGAMIGRPQVQALDTPEQIASATRHDSMGRFPQEMSAETLTLQSPAVQKYWEVYHSIPYSRAEYLANPGYRHEATMEILFGEMRTTVIHRHDTAKRVYNHAPIHEGPKPTASAPPFAGVGFAGYVPWRGIGWTPNSTYRRSPTVYGPLFNHYYRPLGY